MKTYSAQLEKGLRTTLNKGKYYFTVRYARNTKHKPHQGASECSRRVAQGLAGTCHTNEGQYNKSLLSLYRLTRLVSPAEMKKGYSHA